MVHDTERRTLCGKRLTFQERGDCRVQRRSLNRRDLNGNDPRGPIDLRCTALAGGDYHT